MSFYRALSRSLIRNMAAERAVVPWYHQEQPVNAIETFMKNNVYPVWFKYVKGPFERYHYERVVAELRGYGLMQDDQHTDKEPVTERALELLPHDLMVGRYRRLMRAQDRQASCLGGDVREEDPLATLRAKLRPHDSLHGTLHRGS
eukprot:TRINITY_DN3233_c0_g1_i2.p1 TRINITY_DN3233_c0_g1~~TRINITY_DN3233_c0_g1_i2.p1  ORF type:complete len:146 (-),score=22.08 TRINITY_DN3233_c0_g1_i2:202-639(-)